jgi:hypothetical protein
VFQESYDAIFCNRPIEPQESEGHCHRCGHVEIGITTTEKRMEGIVRIAIEASGIVGTDGAHSWNQTEPVSEQDQNKNRGEKPKRFFDKVFAEDAFEKIVEAFHKPLDEVLQTSRDQRDLASRKLCDQDDHRSYDPDHQHRVGDCDRSKAKNFLGMNRQVIMASARRHGWDRREKSSSKCEKNFTHREKNELGARCLEEIIEVMQVFICEKFHKLDKSLIINDFFVVFFLSVGLGEKNKEKFDN